VVSLIIDENAGLHEWLEHLREEGLSNVCRGGKFIERERVVVIVLQQHSHLICARHKDVLLIEIVGPQLIFGVIPKPGELPTRVLCPVVFLEPVIGQLDVSWDDEPVLWRVERPEVRPEDHNAKVHVRLIVTLLHALSERVRQILAETHVYNIGEQPLRVQSEGTYL